MPRQSKPVSRIPVSYPPEPKSVDEQLEEVFSNPEFNKAADQLIETIRQQRERTGQSADKEDTLKIASKIIEGRLHG